MKLPDDFNWTPRRVLFLIFFILWIIVSIDEVYEGKWSFYLGDIEAPRWLILSFNIYATYMIFTFIKFEFEARGKFEGKAYKRPKFAPINLDKIPNDDKEWIEEIKVRKQRGDKMAAYSSKGEAAAKRKAKALGLEDCFVEFLSEEEIRKQRGW